MKSLPQAINEADDRWQHGIGNSGASWEVYIADAVIQWFKEQDTSPTDIIADYL